MYGVEDRETDEPVHRDEFRVGFAAARAFDLISGFVSQSQRITIPVTKRELERTMGGAHLEEPLKIVA